MKTRVVSAPGLQASVCLAANQMLVFDDPEKACVLTRGQALLVLSVQRAKRPPRHHRLLEIDTGQFFCLTQPDQPGYSLSLFTCGECEVFCPGYATHLFDDASYQVAADRWVSKLQHVIAQRYPTSSPDFLVNVEQAERLNANTAFTAKTPAGHTQGNWIALHSGEICLGDANKTTVAAQHSVVWLPADESLWFTVMRDAQISVLTTDQVPTVGKRLGLLWLVHALVAVQQTLDCQHSINVTTPKATIMQVNQDSATAQELASVQLLPPVEAQEVTPLTYALDKLEQRANGPFNFPPEFDENAPLEQQLETIANHSGTQVRKIQLPSDWHHHDYQDLLAVTRESQTPVAVVREPQTTTSSNYLICVPPSLRPTRGDTHKTSQQTHTCVSCSPTAPELEPTAYLFTIPLVEESSRNTISLLRKLIVKHRSELTRIGLLSLLAIGMSLFVPLVSGSLMNQIIPDGAYDRLLYLAGMFLGLTLITTALNYLKSLYLLRIQTLLNWRMQEAVMNRMLQLPVTFINRYSSGDMQNRLTLISSITTELYTAAFTMLMNGVLLFVFLFLCYWSLPELGWIALATTAAFMILAVVQVYLSYIPSVELEEREGKIFGFSHQMIVGLPTLRMAAAEHRAYRVWCDKFNEVVTRKRKLLLVSDIDDIASPTIIHGGSLMVMAAAGTLILNSGTQNNTINLGAYFIYYFSFQGLVSIGKEMTNLVADMAVLWFKRTLILPILRAPLERTPSRTEARPVTGKIELKNISFRYGSGPLVLNAINLSIRPGQFIAIVGPSGAGKSTLLRLLLGFEDPVEGSVLYDEQDLANLDLQSVRRQLGVVMQNSTVPAGTIAEIIAGNTSLSIDETWAAAMVADIANDIDSMPMKMNTVMNHGAPTLSGGQRQRLMIARAIAARRRILLFDESTSALDNVSQRVIADNLNCYQVTRVVIAHRLSTVRHADWIYVMDGGDIVQQGTFATLHETDGLFRRLAQQQLPSR